jgi:hypothetical protein
MIHLSNKFAPKIPVLLNYQLLHEDRTLANRSASAVKRLPTSLETGTPTTYPINTGIWNDASASRRWG